MNTQLENNRNIALGHLIPFFDGTLNMTNVVSNGNITDFTGSRAMVIQPSAALLSFTTQLYFRFTMKPSSSTFVNIYTTNIKRCYSVFKGTEVLDLKKTGNVHVR
jgi:hypothetical protein